MVQLVHKFELAGLGKAPFRFIGCEAKTYQAHPGAPVQVGGSCDYCGTGIVYQFWCESSDGKKFKVGCDCIYKIEGPNSKSKLYNDVEKADRAIKAKFAAERVAHRIANVKAILDGNPNFLTDTPHPRINYPVKGKLLTGRDYVDWLFKNAGTAGKTKACRLVEKAWGNGI